MDEFIELSKAAELTGVSLTILIQLVSSGKLDINTFEGRQLVNKMELDMQIPLRQRLGYQQFSSLAAQPIHITAASSKYGVPQQTISRWVQRGWIEKMGSLGRKTMVSEGDAAYYASLYKAARGSQGKWTFAPNGTLYQKKGTKH